MGQGPRRRLTIFIGLTVAYFAVGRLGLSFASVHSSASPVWPPAGIALAALLRFGPGAWPAIGAGAFLVNLSTSWSVVASLGIAAGNTAEALIGAWLVRRSVGGAVMLRTAPGVFRFAAIAATAALVAATVGVASLSAAGLVPAGAHGPVWLTWWLGDLAGVVVFAPPLLTWIEPAETPRRRLETAAFLLTVGLTTIAVFVASPIARARLPAPFLALPVLLWGAFRLGQRETALGCALLSGLAVVGTLRGTGPFGVFGTNDALLLLQGFIGVAAIAMLAAGAEVAARRAREAEVRRLNAVLERRVAVGSEELQRAHARLLDAQEVAHVGSWEWDIEANAVWWSPELYRIYGADPDAFDASYEAFLARVHPDDRSMVDAAVRRALEDRAPFTFEHRIVRPDGAIRLLYARGRVMCGSDGRPVRMLGTGQDVTERRQAEEARAQLIHEQAARHEAEEASRAKDAFLASLSHELRTPVNAVLGWAHMLMHGQLPDAARGRAMDTIYRNALSQQRLVSDLLDVARIASGSFQLRPASVAIAPLAESAADAIRPAAIARGVTLAVEIDRSLQTIVADEQRLRQVLTNLLENAVKFTQPDSRVAVRVVRADASLRITVEDEGPGIDPAFLPHIFERFRQADASTTREHGGLGLGLSIVRRIVELHGGSVTAANRAGHCGAVFTVTLPHGVTELV